jgi:adenylate kinase
MHIVILGAPGSGKRTQTDLVAEKYGLSPVMTGELVKQAVQEQTPLGIEIKGLQDTGRVVTEDIILTLLREQLLKIERQDGFILDGFPRNLLQALTLDELMIEIDQPLDLVLLIDIETDTLMERLVGRRTCRGCGLLYNLYRNPPVVDGVCDVCGGRLHQRSDDNEETVSNRIHVFEHLISPLITHYVKQDKLVRIDGNGDVAQTFQYICKAIDWGSRTVDSGAASQGQAPSQSEALIIEVKKKVTQKKVVTKKATKKKISEKRTSTSTKKVSNKKIPSKKAVAKKKALSKKKVVVKKAVARLVKKKVKGKKISAKKGKSAPKSRPSMSENSAKAVKKTAKAKAKKRRISTKSVIKKVVKKTLAKRVTKKVSPARKKKKK